MFKETTEDTGNVGRPGHDSDRTWDRFYAKYRTECIAVVKSKYPQWANEAEDVFQRVAQLIDRKPGITNRRPGARFRTVLCRLCTREMRRLHHPDHERAVKTFASQPLSTLRNILHPRSSSNARLEELVLFIRDDMLDPNYENGRHFESLDEEELSLWRHVQLDPTCNASAVARRLGLDYSKVNRAKNSVNRWIKAQAKKMAQELQYLD